MTTTAATTTCQHENLMVTNGTVRCGDCPEWFHDHKDSAPRPGLVAAGQWQ